MSVCLSVCLSVCMYGGDVEGDGDVYFMGYMERTGRTDRSIYIQREREIDVYI